MKLDTFEANSLFNVLREKMNAHLIAYDTKYEWQKLRILEIRERLNSAEGISTGLQEVKECSNGTFEYEGEKVLVYIRDQKKKEYDYKFHVSRCEAIEKSTDNKSDSKYVVSSRNDGIFTVNILDKSGKVVLEENTKIKMNVCRYCLRKVNYRDYASAVKSKKNELYNSFTLEDFFSLFPSSNNIKIKVSSSEIFGSEFKKNFQAPVNRYSDSFNQISRDYRKIAKYRCTHCRFKFDKQRHLLHSHHVDHNKANNKPENIVVLCIACHSLVDDDHTHLQETKEYYECIYNKFTSLKSLNREIKDIPKINFPPKKYFHIVESAGYIMN